MPKKKAFIDKKKATTFNVVHRSQRDAALVNDPENTSKFVLISARDGQQLEDSSGSGGGGGGSGSAGFTHPGRNNRDRVNILGMDEDGYDYEQHLRPMTGQGTFIGHDGAVMPSRDAVEPRSLGQPAELRRAVVPDEVLASEDTGESQMESIAIAERYMESDMRAILEDRVDLDDENNILQDDFVALADQLPDDDGTSAEFDFDAHVANLMRAASGGYGAGDSDEDEDEYEELTDDDGDGAVRELTTEERERMEREFEETLREYSDDEIGDIEEQAEEGAAAGYLDLESKEVDGALDEFLKVQRREEEAAALGVTGAVTAELEAEGVAGPSKEEQEAAKVTQLNRALEALELDDDEGKDKDKAAASFAERLRNDLPYLKRREKEKWDCETVISTLSNLDNRPSVIGDGPSHKPAVLGSGLPEPVHLCPKTGMPLGVLGPVYDEDEDGSGEDGEGDSEAEDNEPKNLGMKRNQKETKEEKRARKAAVKAERRARRQAKKETKTIFREEVAQQKKTGGSGQMRGQSIFKM